MLAVFGEINLACSLGVASFAVRRRAADRQGMMAQDHHARVGRVLRAQFASFRIETCQALICALFRCVDAGWPALLIVRPSCDDGQGGRATRALASALDCSQTVRFSCVPLSFARSRCPRASFCGETQCLKVWFSLVVLFLLRSSWLRRQLYMKPTCRLFAACPRFSGLQRANVRGVASRCDVLCAVHVFSAKGRATALLCLARPSRVPVCVACACSAEANALHSYLAMRATRFAQHAEPDRRRQWHQSTKTLIRGKRAVSRTIDYCTVLNAQRTVCSPVMVA